MRKVLYIIPFLIFIQACYLLGPSPKKRLRQARKIQPIDVAIVPGLPLYHGTWDTLLKTRILWSVYLYKQGVVKKILYSGNAVYTKWIEGKSMADYAMKLGVSEKDILIDTIAEHSTENLYYGHQLAKKNGCNSFAVATDPFQCAMLRKFSKKKIKDEVHLLPVVFDSIAHSFNVNPNIDTTKNIAANFIPIEQKQDMRKRMKGTRGKNIPVK